MASGDPKPTGTLTFLGLALRQLPQELLVLLLQPGQAAVQGSLPALGLPQLLLRVLGDEDSRVRATPAERRQPGQLCQRDGDSDSRVDATPVGTRTAGLEPP